MGVFETLGALRERGRLRLQERQRVQALSETEQAARYREYFLSEVRKDLGEAVCAYVQQPDQKDFLPSSSQVILVIQLPDSWPIHVRYLRVPHEPYYERGYWLGLAADTPWTQSPLWQVTRYPHDPQRAKVSRWHHLDTALAAAEMSVAEAEEVKQSEDE